MYILCTWTPSDTHVHTVCMLHIHNLTFHIHCGSDFIIYIIICIPMGSYSTWRTVECATSQHCNWVRSIHISRSNGSPFLRVMQVAGSRSKSPD